MSVAGRIGRRLGARLDRTASAIGLVFGRYDSLSVVVAVTVGYLAVFLWLLGDLSYRPDVSAGLLIVDDPLGRALERTGPATFEAVAMVDTGVVRLLVSPVNLLVGLALSTLVGLNLALSYLAVVQPAACSVGAGSGLLASLPALLSGTVCCGPVILLVLGIQATGVLLTLFAWLLPVGVAALLGSLVYVAGNIEPAATSA